MKICCFTGTRAEYGLFKPLLDEIREDPELELQLIVSGMHLSPEFGLTYRDIEDDGFQIAEKIEILLSSDTPVGISKSIGLGLMGLSDSYRRLTPDMVVLLGDRFETFAAACAAYVARIPILHLYGGETTRGACDEAFRHAITKMSYLHAVSTEEYRRRVIQLGESPDRVFNVGALGVENIRKMTLLSRAELEKAIDFKLGEKSVLVTFHPVTLERATAKDQFQNLLEALEKFDSLNIIFTKANADAEGRIINQLIDDYVAGNPESAVAFASMGQLRYLSAAKHVDAVIGNSSSGIIEVPSLGTPTVNIGDRQAGRVKSASVIDCEPSINEIFSACHQAFSEKFNKNNVMADNPYEQKDTAARIKEIINNVKIGSLKKEFFDLSPDCFKSIV